MKKIIFTIALVSFALVSFTNVNNETTNQQEAAHMVAVDGNVNVTSSVLNWKGFKPGGSHEGTVGLQSGNMIVADGVLQSGTFVVDLTSMKNTDIKSKKYGQKLIDHLSSSDFFDVEKFPTASFVITQVAAKEKGISVTGNLTIKGVTKEISFPASLTETANEITFTSDVFEVNRADFNVRYGSKSFFSNLKNKFINDMMEFHFVVKATK